MVRNGKIASCQLAQRKISGVMYPVSPIQPDLHSSQLVIVGRVGWQDTNLLSSWSSPSNFCYGARSIRVPHTRARENVLIAGRQLLLKQLWRSLWKGWQASTLASPDMPPLLGGDWNRTSISDARFGRGLRRIILRKGLCRCRRPKTPWALSHSRPVRSHRRDSQHGAQEIVDPEIAFKASSG